MQLSFYKYHGNGNDFILIDNRANQFPVENHLLIKALCNRNLGIGADGLMLLTEGAGIDFQMLYFNSDGREGTMCGNGGRCIVKFASKLGIIDSSAIFTANDGIHHSRIDSEGIVHLKMKDVSGIEKVGSDYVIDTGSPHYVVYVDDLESPDLMKRGREIRYSTRYSDQGINVNFVKESVEGIKIRTYERGVENETLACGTGSVAAALSMVAEKGFEGNSVKVETQGGPLEVSFIRNQLSFSEVWLTGPAKYVFEGKFNTRDLDL